MRPFQPSVEDAIIEDARAELSAMRDIVAAALKWADSDAITFDDNTPRESRELYKATIAYIRQGFTL